MWYASAGALVRDSSDSFLAKSSLKSPPIALVMTQMRNMKTMPPAIT